MSETGLNPDAARPGASPAPFFHDSRHGDPGHRRHESLDAIRGLLLLLIGVTHVPIPYEWESLFSHPLGFVSAAEGFFFISGLVAGLAYTRRLHRFGWRTMALSIYRRALDIYVAHLATALAFVAWVQARLKLTGRPPSNATPILIERPVAAFLAMATLVYQPGIIDILPTYCLFLAVLPGVLALLERGRAAALIALSAGIWLWTNLFEPQAPFIRGLINTGAFNIGAWQLLFFVGAVFGHRWACGKPVFRLPPWWVLLPLLGLAVYFFGIRHALWPACVPEHWRDWLTNKNNVAPVRLLNVAIIFLFVVLIIRRVRRLPFSGFLSMIGRHSLPVFTAHILAVLLVDGLDEVFADTAAGRVLGPVFVIATMTATSFFAERRTGRRAVRGGPAQG